MQVNLSTPLLFNEEQKKRLHELHLVQQRQLDELIRQQQFEQMKLLQSFNKKEETPIDKSLVISQKSSFTPYTLSQYKQLKLQPILNVKTGLGPTLELNKWHEQKDKMDRMLEFAEQIKMKNRSLKRQVPRTQPKQEGPRQKGIEFAASIEKPHIRSPQVRYNSHRAEPDILQEYELRNQQLREQIERLK